MTRFRRMLLFVGLLGVLAAAACGGGGGKTASHTDLSPSQLQQMLAEKDFVLVNTHVPFEGTIPGTDLSIPYNEIGQRTEELPGKDAKIVLYCRTGRMSTEAAETLSRMGYTHLYELQGGMVSWSSAGLPLESR